MNKLSYLIAFVITFSFLATWNKAFSTEINTGNILSNSTFGTGDTTTTTGWSTSGDDGIHTHGAWNGFPYQTGMDDTGGVLAFEGHEEDNVYQDVDLVGDGHLTQPEMNQGFTSTMGADVWFWNNIENTLTLKQTVTGADGSVSTQVREITDSTTGGGTFTNYTNVYIQGSNTQTDITIRTELFNETAGTAYDDSHRGPDVDNVTLNITYNEIPPINEDAQDVIDNIENNIPDIPEDWYDDSYEYMPEDDWSWEDDYVIIEDNYIDDFEDFEEFEEYDMEVEFEDFNTVVIEDFEEFEVVEFEEPGFEFFEETDFDMAPPEDFFEEDYGDVEIIEEIFEEEFEEEFTAFLEESGMAEEFEAFLEEEGMTEQEFFEEIAEEEFNDELTEESFEEIDEPLENSPTNEESVSEVAENETEAMEPEQMEEPASETKQEDNVAKNESEPEESEQDKSEEKESDSASAEDTEVQSEEDGEQETVQQEEREVDSEDGIATDVAKIESKVNKNLKNVAKQIAKIVKQNTKNLTKEELFFKNNEGLSAYVDQDFYKSKSIYEGNLGLFNTQVDLGAYSMEIYVGAALAEYTGSDPIEKRIQKLDLLSGQKAAIMLELKNIKKPMKIIEKLSTYAALIGVIGAIGGGFYTWGQFNTRLDAIESTPSVDLSPLKEKDKELNIKVDNALLYANEYKVDLIDRIAKVEEQIKPTDLTLVFKEIGKIREQIAMLPEPADLQPILEQLQMLEEYGWELEEDVEELSKQVAIVSKENELQDIQIEEVKTLNSNPLGG